MSKILKSQIFHQSFGNCMKLENGLVELLVTLDFGPRVIHFSRKGKENVFYEDPEKQPLGEALDVYGGERLRLCGGHRLWVAPEVLPRCYYPDNAPVEYTDVENGMEFTAPVERLNQIQKSMTLTLNEGSPSVIVRHTVKNCSHWDLELGLWGITMLDKGGRAVIPMPNRQTGFLANRNISLWDYSRMNDQRVYWGSDYIVLSQNEDITEPFKLGLNNEAGWAAYFNKGQLFLKFFEPEIGGCYPDNGCCYETYVNHAMLESETLGEIVLVEPEAHVTHAEEWELYEEDACSSGEINEAEIKKRLEPYVS